MASMITKVKKLNPATTAVLVCDIQERFRGIIHGFPSMLKSSQLLVGAALIAAGTPERQARMRVNQIWQWIYQWGVRDFAAMTNLAKGYRADLAGRFVIETPEVVMAFSAAGVGGMSREGTIEFSHAPEKKLFDLNSRYCSSF